MKNYKPLMNKFWALVLMISFFFVLAPKSYAQTDQDWSAPVNLSNSGSAVNPILVRDFRGTLHAIWEDRVDGYRYSQSTDGNTWTRPQTVKFPFQPQAQPLAAVGAPSSVPSPVLLADKYGSIYVFWIDTEASLMYGQTTSADLAYPGRWRITRLVRGVLNFDAILDTHSALHIAYIHNVTTLDFPAGVYYMHSNLGGGYWSKPAKLYESEYFPSLKLSKSFIRVASSDLQNDQKVYVTWDMRMLKRVFMAVSTDAGLNWSDAQQIKGPEDTKRQIAFNLNVAAFGGNVLLIWGEGEQGSAKCTVYSQQSGDDGKSWNETVAVLGGSFNCPQNTKFITQSQNYVVALLVDQVDSTVVAWDGKQWSQPQIQTRLPTFSNPLTFDVVMLGCRYDLVWEDHLYVVGCDQGIGGDVWFLSRSLEPVESWFSPLSVWTEPDVLLDKLENPERVSYFSSVPDDNGYIHAVWAQSTTGQVIRPLEKIEYARWDGKQWSKPVPVITSSNGMLVQLSLNIDLQERLLLTGVDNNTGDLIFSWAKSNKASLPSEWADLKILPSPSQINASPDLVVDGSGRIVVVYAVPVNENRGIYVIQSTDGGDSWSLPELAFDAVLAQWEGVEQPKICLGADGVLNLSFVRDTKRVGQPVGLYYSQSADGGVTWSNTQVLSEDAILWQKIMCSGQTVHVLWQGYDGLEYTNMSRISQDSGKTWGQLNTITGVSANASRVAVAMEGPNLLHFIQLVENDDYPANQENVILQDVSWDGSSWNLEAEKAFTVIGNEIHYSLSADITSTGFLGVFLSAGYANPTSGRQDQVFLFSRFLSNEGSGLQPLVSLMPTPASTVSSPNTPLPLPTPSLAATVLNGDSTPTLSGQRNLVGVLIVGFGIIIAVFILLRRVPIRKK